MTTKFVGDLAEYPESFLGCRVDGHNWTWVSDWRLTCGPGGTVLEFHRLRERQRCRSLVSRHFDGRTGRSLGATSYRYADRYLVPKQLDVGRARLEALRRAGLLP